MSRKFPVTAFGYGNLPTYLSSLDFMRPVANPFNPYATDDAQLRQSLERAVAEPDPTTQAGLFQQAVARLTDLAWFAPVVRMDGIAVTGTRVAPLEAAADNGLPSVVTVRPGGLTTGRSTVVGSGPGTTARWEVSDLPASATIYW